VLYQNGPHSFNYTIINPDGNVIVRQTYDYTTRPRMQGDSDGNVTMTGGNRHVTPDDLPPPKVAETNATKPTP
jgi:hypothetical protein